MYSHSSEDIKGRNPRSSSVVDFKTFRQKVRANKKNLLALFFSGVTKTKFTNYWDWKQLIVSNSFYIEPDNVQSIIK